MTIESNFDVKKFFSYLNSEYDLLVDPDCPFEDYVTPSGEPTFDNDQCEKFNTLMDKCHQVAGDDVYTIAMDCNAKYLLG